MPDAQVEYVNAAGHAGRSDIEIASERYHAQAIRAKPRAGLPPYARLGAPRAGDAAAARR